MPYHSCTTTSPSPSSLTALGRMCSHLNKLFFLAIFSPVMFQKAALGCKTRVNDFPSPRLYSKTSEVIKGQNVSLVCFFENKSLNITYSLFLGGKHLRTQDGKGESKSFSLRISEAHDLGPYKCKAQVSECSKYSQEFNFTPVDPVDTPVLEISVIQAGTDRHIILRCISHGGSLPISYTFFEKNVTISPAISKHIRVHAEFNFTKKTTGNVEEYRCEAKNRLPNNTKYSPPVPMPLTGEDSCPLCLQLLLPGLFFVIVIILIFWILPKYKARKAMRAHEPKNCGDTPMETVEYANICTNQKGEGTVPGLESRQYVQDGTDHSWELHYASPMVGKAAPGAHEACNDDKTAYVYSEVVF